MWIVMFETMFADALDTKRDGQMVTLGGCEAR